MLSETWPVGLVWPIDFWIALVIPSDLTLAVADISPFIGSSVGLPKTYDFSGSHELIDDDSPLTVAQMKAADVDAQL